jgi:hypothetical protein
LYREHGRTFQVANVIGCSLGAVDNRVRTHGLRQAVDEAKAEWRATQARPRDVVASAEDRRAHSLEAELKELRKERDRLENAVVSQEAVFDRLRELIPAPVKVSKFKVAKQNPRLPARSAIAPIFDQQFGQFVRPLDTPGGKGGYSVEVFDRRLKRWVEGVTGSLRDYATSHRVEELIIPFGGDHVEGDEIFAGQAWQLELDPPRQAWELAIKMQAAVTEVVRFAREEIGVKFVGCFGVDDNHGKVGGKRGGARPSTYSWNWLFLSILQLRLEHTPIDQFAVEPGGALFFHGAGHQFQLIHGHQIRGWGGLPFYGLTRFDGRSIRMHNTIYRYLLMGHHHQPAMIPNGAGETIVSGDWVGANNLSGTISAVSRPQQNLLFVARKWGITEVARIYFQEADDAYAQPTVYGRAA